MSYFEVTPHEILSLEPLFLDETTGRWIIPTKIYSSVRLRESDPVNDSKKYQEQTIDHFDYRLRNRWLPKKVEFRKLLKYFQVEEDGDKVTVRMIDDLDKTQSSSRSEEDRKYIFDYIESIFLGENNHFVKRVLREYVRKTKAKWYDLIENCPTIIELMARRLRRRIEKAIIRTGEKNLDKE